MNLATCTFRELNSLSREQLPKAQNTLMELWERAIEKESDTAADLELKIASITLRLARLQENCNA